MPAPHCSVFLQAGCPSCRPTNSVKALTATYNSAIFTDRYSDCCIASLLSTGIKHLFTVSELHTGQQQQQQQRPFNGL